MNGSIVSQHSALNQVPPTPPSPLRRGAGGEVSWPYRFGGQRRGKLSQNVDPYDRLVAAIACQAIIDLIKPPYNPKMNQNDRRYAWLFLMQNRQLFLQLNIPGRKLDFLAEWLEQREEVQP